MICEKCRGDLFVDTPSIRELKARGYNGARFRCILGCTDIILKERIERHFDEPALNIRERHHYTARGTRTIKCEICGSARETTGNNCRYCEQCSQRVHDEKELLVRRRKSSLMVSARRND